MVAASVTYSVVLPPVPLGAVALVADEGDATSLLTLAGATVIDNGDETSTIPLWLAGGLVVDNGDGTSTIPLPVISPLSVTS